jgi:lipoprotein NlpD
MNIQSVTQQSNHSLYIKPAVMVLFYLLLILVLMVGCSQSTTTLRRTPFPRSLTQYIVVKGDTLYSIAYRAGVDVKQLIRWNHLAKPYTLFPGQTIKLRSKTITFIATSQRRKNRTRSHARKALQPHNIDKKNTSIAEKTNKSLKILWRWPLTGVVVMSFNQTGRKGIDIAGKLGDTILAAASGKVVYSGPGLLGYGNLIIIKHDLHYLTAYANNRRLFVKEGQAVRQSQQIAEAGALSGKKPSLHFEIRRDGKPVNPLLYLPKR